MEEGGLSCSGLSRRKSNLNYCLAPRMRAGFRECRAVETCRRELHGRREVCVQRVEGHKLKGADRTESCEHPQQSRSPRDPHRRSHPRRTEPLRPGRYHSHGGGFYVCFIFSVFLGVPHWSYGYGLGIAHGDFAQMGGRFAG